MTIASLLPNQADLPSPNGSASYWLSQPSPLLHGHRTTPELPPTADVIVIGSGITGAFAARALKEGWARDKRVVMLEAREICSGATGRNGGHCQPSLFSRPPNVSAFELRNFAHVHSLVKENAIPCNWRSATGVNAIFDAEKVTKGLERREMLRAHHPELAPHMDMILPSDPRFKPLQCPAAQGIEVQYNAATLWPYKLIAWVIEQLVKEFGGASGGQGFNLQTNTPVLHLQQLPKDGWLVHTARGQISAPQVLLATNAYTSRLLPKYTNVIVPTQGQVAALRPVVPATGEAVNLEHTYGIWGHDWDDYLAQVEGDKRDVIMGGGRRFSDKCGVGVSDDSFIDPTVSRFLRRTLVDGSTLDLAHLGGESKEYTRMEARMEWTGIMGYSYDDRPLIGLVPESMGGGKGLWLCGGYTGHGMPVAPLAAKAIVEMMGGKKLEEVDLPLQFDIARHAVSDVA